MTEMLADATVTDSVMGGLLAGKVAPAVTSTRISLKLPVGVPFAASMPVVHPPPVTWLVMSLPLVSAS
jgi:hypothetical protein